MNGEEQFLLPEITPQELAGWMQSGREMVLLDVREPYEFPRARMTGERILQAPLSELARKGASALPEGVAGDGAVDVVVFCHHGVRSAQVTAWLLDMGWKSVYNLSGGIDAYARLVDPSVGLY